MSIYCYRCDRWHETIECPSRHYLCADRTEPIEKPKGVTTFEEKKSFFDPKFLEEMERRYGGKRWK